MGGRNPDAVKVGDRTRECADGVVIMSAEMNSLQRQHASALAIAAEME